MIDRRNIFDQPVKYNLITYDNIWKIATGQRDDCTTGCLLDYPYFKNHYKMIEIDLSKLEALDADPKAIQQINFTANLNRAGKQNVFHNWRSKRNHFRIFTRNLLWIYFNLIWYQYKMTQYNTLNLKLSNSQLKLKSEIKNGTEVTLKISSNVVGHSNEIIFQLIKNHQKLNYIK